MPNSMSCMRERILRISDHDSLDLSEPWDSHHSGFWVVELGEGCEFIIWLTYWKKRMGSFPSPPPTPPFYRSLSYCFGGKPKQLLSFQAWSRLQRHSHPVAKGLRSKGLCRQAGRPQLVRNQDMPILHLKIPDSIHCYLLTIVISRC